MAIPTRTLNQFLQDMSAVVQGSASRLIDLSIGSVLRAILEANAAIALWVQWLVMEVLRKSRAATCVGDDLDSWMADFALQRLHATPSIGFVTISRIDASSSGLAPAGLRVKTADGSVAFHVVSDTNHPAWSDEQRGYVMAATQPSVVVPVEAEAAGSVGNVQAGTVTMLASSVSGIDLVTNEAPTTGGRDAEPDTAFRARFVDYINSRSRATTGAITFAIESVRQGLNFVVQENVDSAGTVRPGHFVVLIDDGTGGPPASLLDTVSAAIHAVRPVGTTFSVHAPSVVWTDIVLYLTLSASGTARANGIRNRAVSAITQYVNGLAIGQPLSITQIARAAYDADPDISNVNNVRINGEASDLTPPSRGVVKAHLVTVS